MDKVKALELLPCPFCGREDVQYRYTGSSCHEFVCATATCPDVQIFYRNIENAYAAYNTRASNTGETQGGDVDALNAAWEVVLGNISEKNSRNEFERVAEAVKYIRAHYRSSNTPGTPIEEAPNVGDGKIWDGDKWLDVAPSMETYAMLNMSRELEALRSATPSQGNSRALEEINCMLVLLRCRFDGDNDPDEFFDTEISKIQKKVLALQSTGGNMPIEGLQEALEDPVELDFEPGAGEFWVKEPILEAARRYLALSGGNKGDAWQPIETAPKDGTDIIVRSIWFHSVTNTEIHDYAIVRFNGVWTFNDSYDGADTFMEKADLWCRFTKPSADDEKQGDRWK